MTVYVENNPEAAATLRTALGDSAVHVTGVDAAREHMAQHPGEDVVVLGAGVHQELGLELASALRVIRPSAGVVLVRRRIDSSLLTDSLRSGVREVVDERDLAALAQAVGRVAELGRDVRAASGKEVGGTDRQRGRVVTVFSAKGGCGKTTLATNLAMLLTIEAKARVCLVDLDLAFGDTGIALQLLPAHTIEDAAHIGIGLDKPALLALTTPHPSGLQVLVAPLRPDSKDSVKPEIVDHILELLVDEFDYVVIDTPPAFEELVLRALDRSDLLVLLATLDVPALKNLKLAVETLDLLAFPRDKWKIVLNRADSKVGLSLSDVEKALKAPASAHIPSSRDVPSSVNHGVPIVVDMPKHPVSEAIRTFARDYVITGPAGGTDEVDEAPVAPADRPARRGGLFRRRGQS
jgi:pilus assembly protein CpaE